MICDRCKNQTYVLTMSYFNTDMICEECRTKERAHPLFEHAREEENKAVRGGNYNYPGIGKPKDL